MTVNVISDIHAAYNPATKEVFYHLPYRLPKDRYVDAIHILRDWFKANKASLSKLKFKASTMVHSYPELFEVKSYAQAVKFLDEFTAAAEEDFAHMDKDQMFKWSRCLTNIDDFIFHNDLNWKHGKTILSLNYDVKDFMFKHLGDFEPSKLEPADYLIIAGDLGLDNTYDAILKDLEKQTAGKFKKILHIAGNHDHWWHGASAPKDAKKPDKPNLSRDYCEHVDGDYVFLGCTLWTPISENSMWAVGRYMNDYKYTPCFSPFASREQYRIQSAWLKEKLEQYKDKKVVVFTHHQPFEELTLEDYKHNGKGWDGPDVNEAYVVMDHSLDDVNKHGNIKLWCCGHTHQPYDGVLHGVHVVRNPIGYGDIYGKIPAENISGTWYNKVVEV